MTYNITTDGVGIVEVVLQGQSTHEGHLQARREAIRLCHEERKNLLLVDLSQLDIEGTVSPMDLHQFGQSWLEESLPPQFRVACCLPLKARDRDDVRFTTSIAQSQGVHVCLFDEVESARTWLLE